IHINNSEFSLDAMLMSQIHLDTAPSCMDDHDPDSLPADEAVARVRTSLAPLAGFEQVALRSALGRILAEDIRSRIDVPGHTNSAMDGFAIKSADIPTDGARELVIIGTAWAGRPFAGECHTGECVRIMTGAPIPAGADTVVILERVEVKDEQIRIRADNKPGQNARKAGEDIASGDVVLKTGQRLLPAHLGLLASLGIGEVKIHRRIRVAFFSTGDELHAIGEPLPEGGIYDSNRYTLYGMLMRLGVDAIDMGVVRDEPKALEQALMQAAGCADAIITSGGVSMGEADLVKQKLSALGKINFWKIALKPGRPLAFGRIENAWFFGLPGNPVSVMVTFYALVQPALKRLMGEHDGAPIRLRMPCTSKLKKRQGRMEYQRGWMERDEQGQLCVRKTGPQGSGILTSMAEANCFIVLPMEQKNVEPGAEVEVMPFSDFV
ncbi:MAG TPA: gephyrin-like molybdotransferase Glp, partial [Gammaproteobacteria bacterium]|nr:gephyrin-like molybdotransferase Glp [Gammaproteobacteria bacterium]